MNWQMKQAKARFSEVFRLVRSEGPQRITRQGKEGVVMISEEEYDRFRSVQPAELSPRDRDLIRSLASDIPALWEDQATTVVDRKTIVRHLVERMMVQVQEGTERVDVSIHWVGGFVSRHELLRPVRQYNQMRDFDRLSERVVGLRRAGKTSREIADELNREGFVSPRLTPFTAAVTRRRWRGGWCVRQAYRRQGRRVR